MLVDSYGIAMSKKDETKISEGDLIAMSESMICNGHPVHEGAVIALEINNVETVGTPILSNYAMPA
jgi:hypothetical protein